MRRRLILSALTIIITATACTKPNENTQLVTTATNNHHLEEGYVDAGRSSRSPLK